MKNQTNISASEISQVIFGYYRKIIDCRISRTLVDTAENDASVRKSATRAFYSGVSGLVLHRDLTGPQLKEAFQKTLDDTITNTTKAIENYVLELAISGMFQNNASLLKDLKTSLESQYNSELQSELDLGDGEKTRRYNALAASPITEIFKIVEETVSKSGPLVITDYDIFVEFKTSRDKLDNFIEKVHEAKGVYGGTLDYRDIKGIMVAEHDILTNDKISQALKDFTISYYRNAVSSALGKYPAIKDAYDQAFNEFQKEFPGSKVTKIMPRQFELTNINPPKEEPKLSAKEQQTIDELKQLNDTQNYQAISEVLSTAQGGAALQKHLRNGGDISQDIKIIGIYTGALSNRLAKLPEETKTLITEFKDTDNKAKFFIVENAQNPYLKDIVGICGYEKNSQLLFGDDAIIAINNDKDKILNDRTRLYDSQLLLSNVLTTGVQDPKILADIRGLSDGMKENLKKAGDIITRDNPIKAILAKAIGDIAALQDKVEKQYHVPGFEETQSQFQQALRYLAKDGASQSTGQRK